MLFIFVLLLKLIEYVIVILGYAMHAFFALFFIKYIIAQLQILLWLAGFTGSFVVI